MNEQEQARNKEQEAKAKEEELKLQKEQEQQKLLEIEKINKIKKLQELAKEPPESEPNLIRILFRLPNGSKITRRFRNSDEIKVYL